MDFVTHACVGALVGRGLAPAEPAPARSAVRWGALWALAPDADHLLELLSAERYLLWHRTATHSLLLAGVAVLAAAAWPRPGRRLRAVVCAGALSSHLLLDVLTPFGTGLLWPFGPPLAVDGLQIVAPWLVALTAVGAAGAAAMARRGPASGRRAAGVALGAVAAFLSLELWIARAARVAASQAGQVVLAAPDWRRPWRGAAWVVRDERLLLLEVDGAGGLRETAPPARFEQEPASTELEVARATAERFLARLRVPAARRQEEGGGVVFEDAEFWAIDPARPPFTVTVSPGGVTTVREHARPLQLGLWLAVVAASWLLTRAPRQEEARAP